MKKLIALFLILAMLVPAAGMAEDRDPIIGAWYFFIDMDITPELATNFQGSDKVFAIYEKTKEGIVLGLGLSELNGQGTPEHTGVGKWSKDGDKYKYSIIGIGENEAYVIDNALYLKIADGLKMKIRRMEYFNPYTDYIYGK